MIRRNINIVDDMKESDYDGVDFSKYGSYVLKWDLSDSKTVKPVEVKHRIKGLGLGAEPLKGDGDALIGMSEGRKEKIQSFYGSKIKVIHGANKGLKAILLEDVTSTDILYNMNKVKAEVQESGEIIYLKGNQIKLRRTHEIKESPTSNLQNQHLTVHKKLEKELTWVSDNIIVRVKDKSYQNGKYYYKKGIIVSIDSIYSFTIKIGSSYLTDMSESQIETVIPTESENSKVKILTGDFKGELGIILEDDKDNKKVIVQVELDVINLKYSECSLASKNN